MNCLAMRALKAFQFLVLAYSQTQHQEGTLRTAFGGANIPNFEVIIPDLGTYQGKFHIASLEYGGEYNGEVTYSVTLESSGSVSFTAA